MIKKLLFITASYFIFSSASAQVCTPDVSCLPTGSGYGFCPDTTDGTGDLPEATVGQPYSGSISFKVPSTGADFGFPIPITKVEVYKGSNNNYANGFYNLPPGITFACSGAGGKCEWPGGSNGCMTLQGTPTVVGTYKIEVYVSAYSNAIALAPFDTVYNYKVVVKPAAQSVNNIGNSKFDVGQNVPNPFSTKTSISYFSSKSGNVNFKVYDMVGKEVYAQQLKAKSGDNEMEFNAKELHLKSGIYFYTISNGKESVTKRMFLNE